MVMLMLLLMLQVLGHEEGVAFLVEISFSLKVVMMMVSIEEPQDQKALLTLIFSFSSSYQLLYFFHLGAEIKIASCLPPSYLI